MSWLPRNDDRGWFRLGPVEVSTSVAVAGLGVLGLILTALIPRFGWLALLPTWTTAPWTLLTWPLVNPVEVWTALSLFFMWYFGTEVENQIGRTRMAWLVGGILLSLTLAGLLAHAVTGWVMLAGLGLPGMVLFLLFILDAPQRPFFGGIPAWLIGVVFLGIDVLRMVQTRDWSATITLLVGAALSVVVARQCGYLRGLTFIPAHRSRTPGQKTWDASMKQAKQYAADRERMDALLAKVSATGLDSLSKRERAELSKLSERLKAARG